MDSDRKDVSVRRIYKTMNIDDVKKFQNDSYLSNLAHHILGRCLFPWSTRWSVASKLLHKDFFLAIGMIQWRIRNFPDGGIPTPKVGVATYYLANSQKLLWKRAEMDRS